MTTDRRLQRLETLARNRPLKTPAEQEAVLRQLSVEELETAIALRSKLDANPSRTDPQLTDAERAVLARMRELQEQYRSQEG